MKNILKISTVALILLLTSVDVQAAARRRGSDSVVLFNQTGVDLEFPRGREMWGWTYPSNFAARGFSMAPGKAGSLNWKEGMKFQDFSLDGKLFKAIDQPSEESGRFRIIAVPENADYLIIKD